MKVAAIGDNCVDVYEEEGKQFPGGNPVNVSVYLRRMGIDASYTGVIGSDEYGRIMRESLIKKGVDISHLHINEGSTAITKVRLVNGNRVFGDYIEGVMESFAPTDEDISFLCMHDLIVSGIWGHTDKSLQKIKAQKDIPIVFDYSDQPEDPIVNASIPFVDYAFFGLEEESIENLREFMKQKQAMGPKVVVVTLGEKGSIAFDGKDFHEGSIVNCSVVDTMGAGDSFIAGYIKGILLNSTVDECMKFGAQSSAVTLGYSGAWL